MKTVFFSGYSGSGKTTAIENITRALKIRGFKVGTLKHVHDTAFTIDTPGKDTWRHSNSGASIVVVFAPNEMAIIRKGRTTNTKWSEMVRIFEESSVDYILAEGLHKRFQELGQKDNKSILGIVCAANEREALELLKHGPRPVCIAGPVAETEELRKRKEFHGIPLVRFPRDFERVLKLIG